MKLGRERLVVLGAVLCLGAAGGCSSNGGAGADAGLPPVDAAVGVDAVVGDGGAADDGGAGGCVDLGGAYTLAGTCTTMILSLPPLVCVRQDADCTATMFTEQHPLTGAVSGDTLDVATDDPPAQSCEAAPSGASLGVTCELPALQATCTGTGTKLAIAEATEVCCDPIAQDCQDPSARCQMVYGKTGSSVSACIPVTGAAGEGEACARVSEETTAIGRDDCAAGLFCVNWSQPTASDRACRALCTSDASCGAGRGCRHMAGSVPPAGLCVETCDLFADPSGCPANNGCFVQTDNEWRNGAFVQAAFCAVPHATYVEGQDCSFPNDCAPGLACLWLATATKFVCQRLCDGAHPCATGTCAPLLWGSVDTLPGLGTCG
jgi:hypothetical protein